MTVMLPQLSLLVVTVVQLTSTQPTYDVTHQGNDVNSCGRTEQVLSQLVKAVSQLQKDVQVVIGNKETNATAKECPADFTYIAPVNGCYKLVNRKWNWDSAGLECRSLHKDAHLVVISDAAEQHEIRKMIDSTHKTTLAGCETAFWTAGQRIDPNSNSTFIWRPDPLSNTVSLMTYTNWDTGQPTYNNQAESCMYLYSVHRRWHDGHCNLFYCSLCEIDI